MSNLFRNILNRTYTGFKLGLNGNQTTRTAGLLQNHLRHNFNYANQKHSETTKYEIVNPNEEKLLSKEIINKVNEEIAKNNHGRLFAVIHVAGKQYKVTEGDVIVIEGYWPPDVGDKISLDKVMVAGGADFSLIGTPLVERDLVNVTGTVIEKTLSHTKTNFKKKRRKQYKNIRFYRVPQTMVRINNVQLTGQVNNPPEVSQGAHTTM